MAQLGAHVRVVAIGTIRVARTGGVVGDGVPVVARRRGGGLRRVVVRTAEGLLAKTDGRTRAGLATGRAVRRRIAAALVRDG